MKDFGINIGIVQQFDTSDRRKKGVFYGFRKMFWTYLRKLNVAFYDPCCDDASGSDRMPVAWDESEGRLVVFNGVSWVPASAFVSTTTTTTGSLTTTTTAAPTTTTTTTTA